LKSCPFESDLQWRMPYTNSPADQASRSAQLPTVADSTRKGVNWTIHTKSKPAEVQ
jgi:hypothetical protein